MARIGGAATSFPGEDILTTPPPPPTCCLFLWLLLQGFASSASRSCLRQQGKTIATAAAGEAPVSSAAALLAPAARRGLSQGLRGASAADVAKAQGISLAAGTAAGAFGSVVGVGGGVLIVPIIAGACRY